MPTWPLQTFAPVPAAFEHGHCYEPFVKYGNFTASDPRYPVGTTVEFSCDPGYTLEQGSTIIECVDPSDPQWNETEPACRGGCWRWALLWMGHEGYCSHHSVVCGGAEGRGVSWSQQGWWVMELGCRSAYWSQEWAMMDAGVIVPRCVLEPESRGMAGAGSGMLEWVSWRVPRGSAEPGVCPQRCAAGS